MAATFTVTDAIATCGVDNVQLLLGMTRAARIASDFFFDDFQSTMDKTMEELDSDFKTLSELTVAQGQIRLMPGVKRNIKAFVQWTRDEIRLGRDPTLVAFPIGQAAMLMRRYKSHTQFVAKAKTIVENAKPGPFNAKTKWEDWSPTFLNFLRSIPGRDGVPLKYVCRPNDAPDPTPHTDFLDDYVAMAPLAGEAFATDGSEVMTYIVSFVAGNITAESKIQPYAADANGRLAYKAMEAHYEGVGMNAIDILKADKILDTLFYGGEKKPHMWWEEFERQLSYAFNTYTRKEGRNVHSEEMKLRILTKKINADFLGHIKAAITLEMTKTPVTMTYEQALANFRNEVNAKFPPEMSSNARTRRVHETQQYSRGRGRGGRGRGGGRWDCGRGRGGRGRGGGRSQGGYQKRARQDSKFVTLTDGRVVESHPSFNFPPDVWAKLPEEEYQRLMELRRVYKQSRQASQASVQQPPNSVPVSDTSTQVSEMTTDTGTGTIMGGRNEQAMRRQGQGRGNN